MTSPLEKHWHGVEYNDAERLGVRIKRVPPPAPDLWHARIVVVHLLTKEENKGNHNLYMDVIDKAGLRMNGSLLRGDNNGIKLQARIDKPANEFGTNFALFGQDELFAWVDWVPDGGVVSSDVIMGVHTRWGGEIVGGQGYGHISYYVIWQLTKGDTPPVPPPPGPSEDYNAGFRDGIAYAKNKILMTLGSF